VTVDSPVNIQKQLAISLESLENRSGK